MEIFKYLIIIKILVIVSIRWCYANFDVYLNRNEVMKLLGLSGELFYVRDGHVNEYAMNFIVLVPASINVLTFNWQSYTDKPLLYSLNVEVSDRTVIPYPHFNVSNSDRMPVGPNEAFSLTLACSGSVTAEVNVTIRLDVNVNNKNTHIRGNNDILNIESIRNNERLLVDYDEEIGHAGSRKKRSEDSFVIKRSSLRSDGADKIPRREHGMISPGRDSDQVLGYPNKNGVVSLIFRRKKICLKDTDQNISSNMVYVDNLSSATDPPIGLLHLTLGSACAIGAVCVTFLAVRFCSFRPLKRDRQAAPMTRSLLIRHEHHEEEDIAKAQNVAQIRGVDFKSYGTDLNVCGKADVIASKKDKACNGKDRLSGGEEKSKEERLQDKIAEITIQRCRIRLSSLLQEGTFGRVYRGTYAEQDLDSDCSFSRDSRKGVIESSNSDYQMLAQNSCSSNDITNDDQASSKADDRISKESSEAQVLVKTVSQQHASREQVSLLLQEGLMLYGLRHPNLLTVLGVSIEDCTAPFIVYRLQGEHHNLKMALQALNAPGLASASSFPRRAVTTRELVNIGLRICQALSYAHSRRCFHGDIAARNCAIDKNLHVRLGDFALSRDLFPQDYHCLGDNVNRPVKWLSHEALTRNIYDAPNDIWEFGVFLWELITLGRMPYKDIDPSEVAQYLEKGYRLDQPKNCPDELFMIMSCCWAINPNDRPTFTQLEIYLQEFYDQLICYV